MSIHVDVLDYLATAYERPDGFGHKCDIYQRGGILYFRAYNGKPQDYECTAMSFYPEDVKKIKGIMCLLERNSLVEKLFSVVKKEYMEEYLLNKMEL